MEFINVFGFKVFSDSLSTIQLTNECKVCNTISPNSYGIATSDKEFKEALVETDYLVLDGVYFGLASLVVNKKRIKRNQGPDVFDFFIKKMEKEKGRVFFLGLTQQTLDKIKGRLAIEYPNVTAGFLSPPFKKFFSDEDEMEIRNKINDFKPDIVFVGMTCPKQEKWAIKNRDYLETKLVCAVGAVFDWYAGNQKEIKSIWWKLRLGWLKRTIDRPEILRRYPSIGIFFMHLLLTIFGVKKYKNGK